MRSAEGKSLKFQGNTGEDRRAGGGGGAGLISMKMSPPFQPLPYGCHDTLGAWRLHIYRAARVFEERCRKQGRGVFHGKKHLRLKERRSEFDALPRGRREIRWIFNRIRLESNCLLGTGSSWDHPPLCLNVGTLHPELQQVPGLLKLRPLSATTVMSVQIPSLEGHVS